ncbi:hypothetical protein TSAR_007310, partial [Trichomalopsis sarcophagae]
YNNEHFLFLNLSRNIVRATNLFDLVFQNMLVKMAASGGIILSSINTIHRFGVYSGIFPGVLSQVRHYAARKGTREKAKKKKVKVEVKKLTFEEKVRRSKKINVLKPDAMISNEHTKPVAIDDVYHMRYFQWKVYSFAEAIQNHREYFHPTMYDAPDSIVCVNAELNMTGVKKTKPVGTFNKIVPVKHNFDHGEERRLLAFCKTEEDVAAALDAGAVLAGGSDIIKLILSGEISLHNYDTVVAHPSMMPEVLTLRGLLKKKYPNIKTGTLGIDIKSIVHLHLHGIKYTAKPYEHFPEYGVAEVPIGKVLTKDYDTLCWNELWFYYIVLSMETEHLEDNLRSAIDSILSAKPKRPGPFITRLRIICPPSLEKFKIDDKLYIEEEPEVKQTEKDEDDEFDDEEEVAVPVAA